MKILLPLVLAASLMPCGTQAADAPFVAGFDRFFRDHTIDGTIDGDLLLSELSCTACHATPRAELAAKRR